jgi:hypothetical protein
MRTDHKRVPGTPEIQTLRVSRRTGHKRALGMPNIMVFKGVFINP